MGYPLHLHKYEKYFNILLSKTGILATISERDFYKDSNAYSFTKTDDIEIQQTTFINWKITL